ncbi:hypothetical protein [Aquimarina litoralis]|nr:hypothetical protein [Aquimarina litoralis]
MQITTGAVKISDEGMQITSVHVQISTCYVQIQNYWKNISINAERNER